MRWVVRVLGALVAVVLVLAAGLYGASEWVIRGGHAVPMEEVAVPRDAASVAEGARLAFVFGCRGCHSPGGEGKVMLDQPMLGFVASPSLAHIAVAYSDAELARAVRHGVRKDGSTLWVMPTNAHSFIADDDMGRLIAWIRSLKPGAGDQTRPMGFGPGLRWAVLSGRLEASVHPGSVAERARPANVGRYVVDAICSACHALDRETPSLDDPKPAPALAPAAAAYDLPEFVRLFRSGKGKSGRDLGLMSEVARDEIGKGLTDEEIAAVHAYLVGEAGKVGK
jgi:cytochrome c553